MNPRLTILDKPVITSCCQTAGMIGDITAGWSRWALLLSAVGAALAVIAAPGGPGLA